MQFMLICNESDADFSQRTDPNGSEVYWGAWGAFIASMTEAGVLLKADCLQGPQSATTLRIRDGKREVADGPFADSKEQLGGYFVIDVPDLDTALDWAARSPSATTSAVEVRPVVPAAPCGT